MTMQTSRVVLVLAALVGVGGRAPGQQAQPQPEPEPRKAEAAVSYSVVPAGDGAVLVETTTGRAWLLSRSADGRAAWLSVERLDTPEKARAWRAEQEKAGRLRRLRGWAKLPADSPLGAAARVALDDDQAEARVAAVRARPGRDLGRWPEAEAALINALRADRSEAVRYEAALALGRCRGGSAAVGRALELAASGGEADGNPAETSARARAAARNALASRQARQDR
jgi:hypothetical protein